MTTRIPTTPGSSPDPTRPGAVNRVRSRQAGHPSGWLGRIIGRVMVKDTAAANDRAIALLHLTEPSTVLEIGFGQGRTVGALVAAGHRVLGADASATMVAQATARNRRACVDGRAQLVHSDGTTVAFPDGSADAALTVHTVYFMADASATIAEVARVLRPGGRFVVACRVGDDPMPAWMDGVVYRIPTIARIRSLLEGAGFTEIAHHPGSAATHDTHWFSGDLERRSA